jgi:hypothetical protein
MPQSRLFMSSISRRQLARRRNGRVALRLQLLIVLLLVIAGVAAFAAGRGGL